MKWISVIIIGFIFFISNEYTAFGESEKQIVSTDIGTYDVSFKTNPPIPKEGEDTHLFFEVITKPAGVPQVHVDYEIVILKNADLLFSSSAQHTHTGHASVTHAFEESGEYIIGVYLDGIMFSPITTETAGFKINVGDTDKEDKMKSEAEIMEESIIKTNIPDWIKQVTEFWVTDEIDDAGFVQAIGFLVKEGIITIPYAESSEGEGALEVPSWIKINAEFWINGDITDDEFAIALEWLINNGIIKV